MKKLFLIALGLISFDVNADPTYDATRGALQNNSALCSYGYNPNCSSGSRSAPPPKKIIYHDVKVPSKFGAVAMNMQTGYGAGVLNKNSLSEAKKEALEQCKQGNKNAPCKVVSWVRNGCIASAKGKEINNPGKWKSFYVGKEKGLAEAEALAQCRADPKVTNCEISLPEGCSLPQLQ
ncbi:MULTISPECIES: DUF4189 domain-containing protein [Neisseria]|uniref:DUF4189 domain-containing protein n=2 Tax=Neisseria macacae ATCC 33926 TaxID=997348 RepID=A0ABY3Y587_9NEIS|nr:MULTISPECIES: DUF4189 domain-containing protein [Neisseria]UNV84463.1 DUF4189 domain-containing protein [Neisseria macacae ATCC 33926]